MNQIGAKLAKLLLCSGDHAGDLGPLVGQRRHDVTFRHIHPRSRNDRGDYRRQGNMMSAVRLVSLRHDTEYAAANPRDPTFTLFDPGTRLVDHLRLPERLPAWLSPADLEFLVEQFERTVLARPFAGAAPVTQRQADRTPRKSRAVWFCAARTPPTPEGKPRS